MELSDRLTNDEIEELEGLYVASFPPEERREWTDVTARAARGDLSLYGIRLGGRIAGMVTVWHLGGVEYVEHFAVDPTVRGNGLGGRPSTRLWPGPVTGLWFWRWRGPAATIWRRGA